MRARVVRWSRGVAGHLWILFGIVLAGSAKAQTSIVSWGDCTYGGCTAPALPPGVTYVDLEAGTFFSAGLLSDGTIASWGDGPAVPPPPPGLAYSGVAMNDYPQRIFAILTDGTAMGWGDNSFGALDVPPLPAGLAYVQLAGGQDHTLALRSDGSVIAWGLDTSGQCQVPPLPPGRAYVEIAAGYRHSMARLSDGSVVCWGQPVGGVPSLPQGVAYVEIGAGADLSVARRSDGSIVQWGQTYGVVPPLPPGVSYVELSCKSLETLARRSDGSLVEWGDCSYGCDIPDLPPGSVYALMAVGGTHSIACLGSAPACGSISSYCWPAAPNSASATGAHLDVAGCPSLTANDLVFTVTGLPPHAFGLFNYSRSQRQVAFGNGSSCVTNHVQRVQPMIAADPGGVLTFALDLTQPPFTGSTNPILPGSARNFQLCYRDPSSPPALFNYSDARHIAFSP
jgi:hypothetical protein